jgi:hypothetical protein
MATIFSAPQIGDPRATGIKNGGIKAFESDIVYPVSRLTTPDGTWSGGKQLEFRWRSDSSRFWSPRDTKLYVKYKVGFGPGMNVLGTQTLTGVAGLELLSAMPKGARCTMGNAVGTLASDATGSAPTFVIDVSKGTFVKGTGATAHSLVIEVGGEKNEIPNDNIATVGALVKPTAPVDLTTAAGADAVKNVRITAAPNTSLFDGGVRYLQNSVVVENQTQPYSACMAQLLTKTDVAGTDTGVAGMLSLRKDVGKSLGSGPAEQGRVNLDVYTPEGNLVPGGKVTEGANTVPAGGESFDEHSKLEIIAKSIQGVETSAPITAAVLGNLTLGQLAQVLTPGLQEASGFADVIANGDNKYDNTNPKQEVLTLGKGQFELAEPMFLASWQHGYAVGPSDHQLYLTINPEWQNDLLHCPAIGTSGDRDYTSVLPMPKDGNVPTPAVQGAVYVAIESVEMHVAFVSPAQAFIPPSQSLRFSQYQVTTRKLHGTNIQESIVVPPGVRQVIVGLRQNRHGIQYDREELAKAGAGINEIPGSGEDMYWWRDFQLQLGSAIAPTVAFSQMNPQEGSMARAYNEFLSVIGKPLGMRGNTLTYADYVGSHNCNGPCGPGKGDHGPVIALRLLTPDSSLSNNLQIRGTLQSASGDSSGPKDAGGQEMVVIVVADSLLDVQYAPPTEIPVSTAVNALV